MLEINSKAPNFKLLNQDGKEITLSDYQGKVVVLYFYPKDNTPGCTKQACSFRDFNQEIKDLGAVVLGVSKDSVASHEKFTEKQSLNFDILSDESLEVIQAYGVWVEKKMYGKSYMGVARATFIINEEGIIEKVYEKASSTKNPEEVLKYLKKRSA